MRDTSNFIVATFFLVTTASVAHAQDDAGWIRADINGEVMEWHIEPLYSDWSGSLEDAHSIAQIASKRMYEGVLPSMNGFSLSRIQDMWSIGGVDIYLVQEGGGFYSSAAGDARVDVSDALMEGELMIIKGLFSAALFYHADFSAEPDMTNVLAIKDATFEVRLPPSK